MNLSQILASRRIRAFTCFGLVMLGVGSLPAQSLKNGDFEGGYLPVQMPPGSKGQVDGTVADGWRDESAWGEVSIAYSEDASGGHAGTSAQKIEVRSRGKGSPQFVQEVKFTAGSTYRVTAWVKAAAPGRASLMLRQSGAPYETYAIAPINLTTEWTQVEIIGKATATDNGLILFLPEEAGTYWIDDVTLEVASAAPSASSAPAAASSAASPIKNGDFEGTFVPVKMPDNSKGQVDGEVADGWRDESAWGEVSIGYSKDPSGHAGSAQKIEVRSRGKGSPQFVQEIKFNNGSIYRVTAWVKAAAPGRATLMLRQSGAPYAAYGITPINLTTEWTQVEVTGKATATDNGLILFLPEEAGTFWIDDVTFQDVSAPTAAAPGASPAVKLANPGLEGAYLPATPPTSPAAKIDGVIAPGWQDESGWGEVSIAYSKDEGTKHGEAAAQKIEVRSIGKGGVLFIQKLPLQADHLYRATAWVKSAAAGQTTLFLRKGGVPYTTYSETKTQLSPEWTKVEVSARVTDTDTTFLAFAFPEPGTYWIDDVTLEDVTAGISVAPSAGGAVLIPLVNTDFEGAFHPYVKSPADKGQVEGDIANGWNDDSAWGDVSIVYGRDELVNNTGKAAQRIEVKAINKGGIQINQAVQLKKGRVYRLTAFLRALINTQAVLQVREKGEPYEIFGMLKANPSPEWRKFEVYARVDKDVDGIINFSPSEMTTFWIDDVKFEDVTDYVGSEGTATAGNLLQNGSFEAGMSEGYSVRIVGFDDNVKAATWEHLDLGAKVDATAAEGKSSLLIEVGPWAGGLFSSPKVRSKFGQTYTASIALKSDRPEEVEISLDGTNASHRVNVTPEWKRFSVSGAAVLGPAVQLKVRCVVRDATSPAHFWLDGVMLEEGKTTPTSYLAPFPAELALTMDRPGSIVFAGEDATLKLAAGGTLPEGAQLKWSVENLAGKVTELPAVTLPADSISIPPDAKAPLGVFKIRAQLVNQGGEPISGEIQKLFSRLPHPRKLTEEQAKNSYFGAHVELTPEKMAIALATGHRWVRLHDVSNVTRWPNVEAKPGVWTWNDEGVKAARAAGLNILGLLGGAPNRVALHPQAEVGYFSSWNVPDAPGALDQWTEYVKQTVTHYAPFISDWEVWNEPYINGATNAFFPNGTPEQYGELLKRASPAIRAANPQARIVGVCSSGTDYPWLDRVLKVAGPEYYDDMSFHGYGGRLQGGVKSQIAAIADELNAVQARYGTPKPLWNTEGGPTDNVSWYVNKAAPMHLQMASMVRIDVAQIAAGMKKFFSYTMGTTGEYGSGDLAELEYDRTIKPIIAARAVLASLVDGATYVDRTEPTEGAEAHTFKQSDGTTVQVLWSFDAKPHSLKVPKGKRALDVLGNPISGKTVQIGEAPIYFVEK